MGLLHCHLEGNNMTLFRTLIKASRKKKRFFDLGQQKAMESETDCAVSKSNQDLSDRASMLGFLSHCNLCKILQGVAYPQMYAL